MECKITPQELSTPSGTLELLTSLPPESLATLSRPPLLCLHGGRCSASDYTNLLPWFAARGHPTYAVSLRGHGKSWHPSIISFMLLTSIDSYADDVLAAIAHIERAHGQAPVLIGHSLGGGMAQYILSNGRAKVPGIDLLASAPLTGSGGEVFANWQKIEAPDGYAYPWSPRFQWETVEQVKVSMFSEECDDSAPEFWLKECRSKNESLRAGALSIMIWELGKADKVLAQIEGMGDEKKRKVLCMAGWKDRLTTKEMVRKNVEAYQAVDESAVEEVVLERSSHHLMLDIAWEECCETILKWLGGRNSVFPGLDEHLTS